MISRNNVTPLFVKIKALSIPFKDQRLGIYVLKEPILFFEKSSFGISRRSRVHCLKKHDGSPMNNDQDKIEVLLRKGPNTILLKVVQFHGQWGFTCRLLKNTDT